MEHKIDHRKNKIVRRNAFDTTVTFTCTCGTRASSKAGVTGALAAFAKHVKRATA